MQQQKTINKLLKRIEEKQKKFVGIFAGSIAALGGSKCIYMI